MHTLMWALSVHARSPREIQCGGTVRRSIQKDEHRIPRKVSQKKQFPTVSFPQDCRNDYSMWNEVWRIFERDRG